MQTHLPFVDRLTRWNGLMDIYHCHRYGAFHNTEKTQQFRSSSQVRSLPLSPAASLSMRWIVALLCALMAQIILSHILYAQDVNSSEAQTPAEKSDNMRLLGSLAGSVIKAQDVTIVGKLAYVAAGENGLRIVDLSDPIHLKEIGAYDTPGNAMGVSVANSIAAIADGATTRFLNIATPATPIEIGSIPAIATAIDVQVIDTTVYVVDEFGLQILSIANPAAPVEVGFFIPDDTVTAAYVVNKTAFVAEGNKLRIVDLSNPVSPNKLGFISVPGVIKAVVVSGSVAYVAAGANGLLLINVANPATPTLLGSYVPLTNATDVTILGATAYVADSGYGVRILNVTNPSSPTLLGYYSISKDVSGIAASETQAFLTSPSSGFWVFAYPACYRLSLTQQGKGQPPTASPTQSSGCSAGEFHAGATVSLNATPLLGWAVSGWVGTSNDGSTSTSNTLIMPGVDHQAKVNYVPVCETIQFTHTGNGSDPVATPKNTAECPLGQYVAGEVISLQAAPALGSAVARWSGTDNDNSTSVENKITAPGGSRTVNVHYEAACFALSLTHQGAGSNPTASPQNSDGCAPGHYYYNQPISVNAAPENDWQIRSWNGTGNNALTATVNSLTMPAANHEVSVTYGRACYALPLSISGSGDIPTTTPVSSPGCPPSTFESGTIITLTARPAPDWQVSTWFGTDHDNLTTNKNTVTMPKGPHTATVSYVRSCYQLTVSHIGDGRVPVVTPDRSSDCPTGRYWAKETITVVAAPEPGWQVNRWLGTVNDSLQQITNSVTMPSGSHTVLVYYNEMPHVGDDYEFDDICKRARAIDTNGLDIQQRSFHNSKDVDWVYFDAVAGTTYRVTAQVSVTSSLNLVMDQFSGCHELSASEPEGEITSSKLQSTHVDLSVMVKENKRILLMLYPGRQDSNQLEAPYQLTVSKLATSRANHAAIIVAGRGRSNDPVQTNINHVGNAVYHFMKTVGYNDESILYLATDGAVPGYDSAVSSETLKNAITRWAASKVAGGMLTLYLVSQGTVDRFYLDDVNGQRVTADELNEWLNQLEIAAPGVRINVIIETCQAGSFITPPGSLSKLGRVIIASTSAEGDAYVSRNGAYFSDYFLNELRLGRNVTAAFTAARQIVEKLRTTQQPWIDTNGNRISNEEADLQIGAERTFSYIDQPAPKNQPPLIVSALPPSTLQNAAGTVRADIYDDSGVGFVWVIVYPPGYTVPPGGQELRNESLPTFLLTRLGDQPTFSGMISGLDQTGIYHLVIHAQDKDGLYAKPVMLELQVGSAPSGGSNRVFLPLVSR